MIAARMTAPDRLDGKRAVVTGAATGIGRTTAITLAALGAHVIINGKDEDQRNAAQEAADAIHADGGRADVLIADVSDVAAIRRLFTDAEAILGGLDIVISNAAGASILRPIAETTEEEYDATMAINARGQFFVLQEAARRIADGGRIIVLSTTTVLSPYVGTASYGGAKRASEIYALALAGELGERNITVNVVAPGPTATAQMNSQNSEERKRHVTAITPLGRMGEPEDIADVIAFLAGEDSGWITRQVLQVGGGIV